MDLRSEVYNIVNKLGPSQQLNPYLRLKLERLKKEQLAQIFNTTRHDRCNVFFIACLKGLPRVVQYMIENGAGLEIPGVYVVPEERTKHIVTPIWVAAVAGHLSVVKILVKAGAIIDAPSDTDSTPVRSSCLMSHYDVVRYLISVGADILKPNDNGGTCLINAVHDIRLCRLLLDNGAKVNSVDVENRTALHYAVDLKEIGTVRLLCENGADLAVKDDRGDDALRFACANGSVDIFKYLYNLIKLSPDEKANALELLGASCLEIDDDPFLTITFWKQALSVRSSANIVKKHLDSSQNLNFVTEYENIHELELHENDLDYLFMQSLLITTRILGYSHKRACERIMLRGAYYLDRGKLQVCIGIWTSAFLNKMKHGYLFSEENHMYFTAIEQLYVEAYMEHLIGTNSEYWKGLEFCNAYKVIRIAGENLNLCMQKILPNCTIESAMNASEVRCFSKSIGLLVSMIFLTLQLPKSSEECNELKTFVSSLGLHTFRSPLPLLHAACTSQKLKKFERFSVVSRLNVFDLFN